MVMEGYQLVALLMGIGVVLIIGELGLPTHGLLGLAGIGTMLAAVVVAAKQNPWAGLALMVALAACTPLAWVAFIKFWPRTLVGRRIILPPVAPPPQVLAVRVGQSGVAISELRPMGMCEFDGTRIESVSEQGVVPAGTAVKVVALVNNRPTVRVI